MEAEIHYFECRLLHIKLAEGNGLELQLISSFENKCWLHLPSQCAVRQTETHEWVSGCFAHMNERTQKPHSPKQLEKMTQ